MCIPPVNISYIIRYREDKRNKIEIKNIKLTKYTAMGPLLRAGPGGRKVEEIKLFS
jgi:hypothetical protein